MLPSLVQLLTSFGPFLAGCVLMYLAIPLSIWLVLALAIPTGALLVRIFIVQHDCGHGAFFTSRPANDMVGRLCSLFTLTPFGYWRRHHRVHHSNWNNFDRTDGGIDLYSSCRTVRGYLALSRSRRLGYRFFRHPLMANVLLPPLIFIVYHRLTFDTPRSWIRERWSVHLTNLTLAAVFGALVFFLGWRDVVLVHVSVVAVTSMIGVWLFTLQHRFPTAHWSGHGTWRFVDAALEGSSWLRLPRPLQWLTGNIGFHHIHHLDQRVPNYRLQSAHVAVQPLRPVAPLGLVAGIKATRLALWDEASDRLVTFSDAHKAMK